MSTDHERRVERILDDIREVLYKILDALKQDEAVNREIDQDVKGK